MSMHDRICGCEQGGDCTKTTVCALDSAAEDMQEMLRDIKDEVYAGNTPSDGELRTRIQTILGRVLPSG